MARGGADDVFAVGPMEVVIPAIERFKEEVWERCHIKLNWRKSKVFCREGELPENTPEGLSLAGEQVGDSFLRGLMVYGVPVGTPEYVSFKLNELADQIIQDAEKTREVLAANRQALWTALRLSISQRFGYWIQLVPPSLIEPVAARLDEALWRILEAATGFSIPRGEDEGGLTLRIPIPGLDSRSFQEWAVRLPVRLYGWGLRSLQDSCGPAFLGTLETAIPYMAARENICPQMADLWGGEDCWGVNAPTDDRWRRVLSSGCSIGEELREIWERIQVEAVESAEWLGEEVPSALDWAVEGIGDGSVSGDSRSKVVEAMENTRAKVLNKALKEVRPKSTRAAWSWRQRDKVSSAWVLAIPGHETSLNNAEFAEAAAANLCLPSPACAGRLGEVIRGRVKVDAYGDNIQATSLCGDHWRKRHNGILHLLHRMCMWAGLPAEMEVFNLFSHLVRQDGLSRVERNRQRQSLVPDMRVSLPHRDGTSQVLHELKVISCSKTRYKPTWDRRAVDKRADSLQHEYIMKARAADRKYNNTPEGQVGRVENKLVELGEISGLVCGNFGEISQPFHNLVAALATSRVRVAGPSRGRRGVMRSEQAERSVAVSSIRRRLGVAAVKGQTVSLLGRLQTLGPGTAAAAGRRYQAMQLERSWMLEERSTALATRQGWNICRSGFAKLD